MRVLLAEDEEDLNFIITQKLRSEGYSVDSCYDAVSYTHLDVYKRQWIYYAYIMSLDCDNYVMIIHKFAENWEKY